MSLDRPHCEALLADAGHGVLATVHARRGVDAVPVCFAVEATELVVPVDTVKPKSSSDLQRARNLDADGRAVLLCDHWDPDDWSRLWWVRAHLARAEFDPASRDRLEGLLTEKYPQYRDRPFAGLLTFRITAIHGWSGDPAGGPRASGRSGPDV
jgi:PPOX class probable F420-dependent enzyme